MSSSSPTLPTEIGQQTRKDALPIDTNLPDTCLPNKNYHMEHEEDEGDEDEDEDEEEDVDFNPFLKETLSPEASSSLSSEIEGLDADVAESEGKNNEISVTNSLSNHLDSVQDYPVGDSEHGEEIVMKTSLTSGQERNLVSDEASFGKENGSGSGIDVVNDAVIEDSITKTQSGKPTVDLDDEDAICMRTRARYSLANFTLDQLENFLQETDDDDDLRNIDDEEEYRKFLAAVLQGGDGDCQNPNGNDNVDDEDEDNDADFELEIEEALESDIDENIKAITEEHESKTVSRRPKTRQNRRQKASVHQTKMFSGQLNRPLRPLLPNAPLAGFAAPEARFFMAQNAMHYAPSSAHDGFVNGFTPSQIGQLHCLIHEHVQLLLQVFSLCVLDPARQHISSDVQGLISDIFSKFNQVLAWRKSPYPSSFFCPPYIKPSVGGENIALPPSNGMITSNRVCEDSTAKQVDNFQSNEGFLWMPYISGPILSILDVAPLRLAGSYINDVSTAMQEHRRRVGLNSDTYFEKEPLFPLRNLQSLADNDGGSLRGVGSPSSGDQIPRKTMAAALVERAKKQSVALVPKEIAQLAQRFLPLFNPALYPHKPPPAPVANRVLFTDAEDKLLALGLMEYNTDWKAIQQRFLPCKSKHQIFVRQKNRSSSKAPENPIKAVRRMKNSPLTAEEKARIEEGLKVFKLDWVSVWKFIVPYRDPSLLPRQWRIANGTQKSYKLLDADKKAKRRLYESMRRKSKPLAMPSWNVSSGKEDNSTDNGGGENKSVDDCSDKEDEAYVHEAFLADWRPNADASDKIQPTHMQPQENSQFNEQTNNIRAPNPNLRTGQEIPNALSSRLFWRPYRARRNKNVQLVKLAPDLPPVNLPPSVRIMSQSAFKSFHGGPPSKNSIPAPQNGVYSQKTGQIEKTHLESFRKNPVAEEKGESELHMHPLLFSGPENSGIQLFSSPNGLFPANQTSLNLSLFHNPNLTSQTAKFFDDSSSKSKEKTSYSPFGIDFHPLLQKDDNAPSPNGRGSELNFEIQMEKSGEQNKIWSESSVSVPKKVDKSVGESMRSGDNAFGNGVNFSDLGDESLPEIVMEKEELSDSEEEDEIGENVEFECEEMADSDEEDEGYNSERIVHVQNNKELQNIESEKVVAVNGSDKAPPIDFERLNLNSRPPDSPGEDPGSAPVRNRRVPVAKRQPPSRSGGRFKSPGTPLKKPRKRARMNESNACESEQIGLNL